MTDDVLIQKFLTGDDRSFNTLVWRWERRIYNFVLRYVGHQNYTRDICQLTFMKAYQRLHQLQDPGKFSTWIYQITLNTCKDELRRQSKHCAYSLEEIQDKANGEAVQLADQPEAKCSNADFAVHIENLKNILGRALQTLPEEQRTVIIMKEYQGLKFTEIADILQTSVNTVKSRMYYGLSALRKVLDKWKINRENLSYEV